MAGSGADLTQIKAGMKATWMAGDFGQIAQHTAEGASEFVGRLEIKTGARVLDVACGTGNLAVPAARAGADVTGVDIATNLLQQATRRAEAEQLKIRFMEGDAENLPFPDHSFDVVMSMFGAMFAPRPETVASELLRVCRPGGMIAMANWTPSGFVGEMFRVTAKAVPPPPGIPAPSLWGEPEVVRERFGKQVAALDFTPRKFEFRYPFPPKEVVQFFRRYFGPTQVAFSKLDEAGQAALAAEMESLWSRHNQARDGATMVQGEYLEVRAVRA